ncbi:MAG: hypothetical protein COA57_14480, partial [Flavobacteriales bacterium]
MIIQDKHICFFVFFIVCLFIGHVEFSYGQEGVDRHEGETSTSEYDKLEKGGIYEAFSSEQEIVEKRGRISKHFKNNDGTNTLFIGLL